MAKRSRRRTGASGTGIRHSLNEAQRAIGGYVRSGSKQVNDAVSTFLSKFDTGHLLDALRKQMRGSSRTSAGRRSASRRSAGRRSGTAASRRRTSATRRRTGMKVRRAAASKKTALRRSSRRK